MNASEDAACDPDTQTWRPLDVVVVLLELEMLKRMEEGKKERGVTGDCKLSEKRRCRMTRVCLCSQALSLKHERCVVYAAKDSRSSGMCARISYRVLARFHAWNR